MHVAIFLFVQCDQIGQLLKFLATKLLKRVAKIFGEFPEFFLKNITF